MQGISLLKPYTRVLRAWFDLSIAFKGMIVINIPLVCMLFAATALLIFQQQRANCKLA